MLFDGICCLPTPEMIRKTCLCYCTLRTSHTMAMLDEDEHWNRLYHARLETVPLLKLRQSIRTLYDGYIVARS